MPSLRSVHRILHVSDLHLERAGTEQYPGLFDRLQRIREVARGLRPDLVVATGDLTNRGASAPVDFALARDWLEGFGVPYVVVPGNHDLGANRERGVQFPQYEAYEEGDYPSTGYGRAFGANLVAAAQLGDLTFLGVPLREDDPDGALAALSAAIDRAPGRVVVAGHYPAVLTRVPTLPEAFGAHGYVDRAAERLREVLDSSEKVIAYLCGHVHLTSTRQVGRRCVQFTAGGLGPGAAALRLYEWDGETWWFETHDVEGPQVFWEIGSVQARRDPYFSRGTAAEREGSWHPSLGELRPVTPGAPSTPAPPV